MRAIGIKNGSGDADALFIDQIPTPTPGPSQALVKINAFGLNRMDLLQREGKYPVPPQAPPTLGVEFSGTIAELGGGATEDFKVGDEVFGLAYGGAYAEYISVATGMLIHKPKELSWEEAAGIPEVCFPPPYSTLYLLVLTGVDMDNSNPSPAPSRGLQARKQRSLARRRIFRLHRRDPTRQGGRCIRNLRDRGLGRENRLLRGQAGRDGGVQLPHAGLGGGIG